MAILAVLDLGTNTFRLLIAKMEGPSSIETLYSENRAVRLGEGFAEAKVIRPPAVERAMAALSYFRGIIKRYPVDNVSVVGTSAIRQAENREMFLDRVKDQTGFEVEVLSGEEEAMHTFLGVNLAIQNQTEPMLVIDIGGGSTEFIGAEGATPTFLLSTELGVVHLTETYLRADLPTPEEIKALRLAIAKVIRQIGYHFPSGGLFAGTAGTVTTLAAIDQRLERYEPAKINRYPLPIGSVERIFKALCSKSLEERRKIPGLEKGREDIIISGALILLTVMELYGYKEVYVSDYGLREGILVDRCQKG